MKNMIEEKVEVAISQLNTVELKKLCVEMPINIPVYYFNLALNELEKRLSPKDFIKFCEDLD